VKPRVQEFMIVDLVRRADPNRCILCSRRRTT